MKENLFNKEKRQYYERLLMIMLADIFTIAVAYFVALWIRFDFSVNRTPKSFMDNMAFFVPCVIAITLAIYYIFRLYHSIWRFASVSEVAHILLAYVLLGAVLPLFNMLVPFRMPRGVLLMGYIISLFFCVLIRFGYRLGRYIVNDDRFAESDVDIDNVLIIGAGQAAREILKEQQLSGKRDFFVKAIVDDSELKQGRYLEGHKVEGKRGDIPELVKKYNINKIIFAIPTAKASEKADILNICKETGCKVQTVPSIAQLVSGEVSIAKIRDVEIADLLGRDEIHINLDEIFEAIKGKVIMVTGGGGSIGSELCRQIAAAKPKQLIIFDIYENNAYAIQQELKRKYPELDLVTLIGSVRNEVRIESVIREYHPEVIYHAAAHKHVPLMEVSPNEAIKNNVMGTYKTAKAAAENGVKRFLLISTDKAVNPTSLMGASKRICEMIIQMMSRKHPETVFMAVRFGNVLGSNGSVIPLFKKQIAEGGPVTVTDPNIIRYFMTIPEAVSLVLEASHYAKGGEIFVLDMGKPVKIIDLARNMIKLSGFTPDENGIPIKIIGLRPGEKLYEELLMGEEGMQKTQNELIFIGHPIEMDDEEFMKNLTLLDNESRHESEEIKKIVSRVVPTYHVDSQNG